MCVYAFSQYKFLERCLSFQIFYDSLIDFGHVYYVKGGKISVCLHCG